MSFDQRAFGALQERLKPMWPTMTLRRRDEERTLVVLSSVNVDVPAELHPLLPAYEERYLSFVLGLVTAPRTRVVYVTSQPILPRMLDYYLDLVPVSIVMSCAAVWSPCRSATGRRGR